MVGRDRVSEDRQRPRSPDVAHLIGSHRETIEEGGLLDVRRVGVPRVDLSGWGGDLVPERVLFRGPAVEPRVGLGAHGAPHDRVDLGGARPEVLQEDLLAARVAADRVRRQVVVHPAGERERDDERRAHEEVRADALLDARLEVAVPRENGGRDDVVPGHRFFDARVERSRVPDAGRATVPDEMEARACRGKAEVPRGRGSPSRPAIPAQGRLHVAGRRTARARRPSSRGERRRPSAPGSTCSCTT